MVHTYSFLLLILLSQKLSKFPVEFDRLALFCSLTWREVSDELPKAGTMAFLKSPPKGQVQGLVFGIQMRSCTNHAYHSILLHIKYLVNSNLDPNCFKFHPSYLFDIWPLAYFLISPSHSFLIYKIYVKIKSSL